MPKSSRQLCAIMFTDIVGYTSLMGRDVEQGLDTLRRNREIHKPLIEKHNGTYLKEIGDGTMAKFNSAIDSVLCALEIQKKAKDYLGAELRIGIHLGDVTIENNDVFGDGVNIASRLQSIADPGGIYVSESINDAIRARKEVDLEYLGELHLKNVDHLVKTYFLKGPGIPVPTKEKVLELTERKKPVMAKPVWLFLIAAVIMAIVITVKFFVPADHPKEIRSLAVLPVEDISMNQNEEWLSAGIHNGLIDELMKIQSLRVISRTSTLRYESSTKSVPEIARELDVDGVLEVSYVRNNNELNIQVRLIRAQPQEELIWRNDYDREFSNALTTYSQVARSVAREINITLSSKENKRLASSQKVDPEAYEAYLKGSMHWSRLGKRDLDIAMDYFEQAREIDPDFTLAYVGIAKCWGGKMQGGYLPRKVAGPEMEKAIDKALSLDSNLVEMHYYRAVSNTWYFWKWEIAEKEFLKTLDLNPNNVDANAYYAHFLGIMGSPEEGLPYAKRAVDLDRINTRIKALYGMSLRHARMPDKALKVLQEAYLLSPRELLILSTLRSAYHDKKMWEKAVEAGKQYYAVKGDSASIKALDQGFLDSGYAEALKRNAEVLVSRSLTEYVTPWQIATLYTRAGMKKKALDWLEKAYAEHDANMPYISADPIFDILAEEPRFEELLNKMDL